MRAPWPQGSESDEPATSAAEAIAAAGEDDYLTMADTMRASAWTSEHLGVRGILSMSTPSGAPSALPVAQLLDATEAAAALGLVEHKIRVECHAARRTLH